MPLDLTDDKSTLVQVMAWCRQATSHYLNQCWPRSMSPNGVTRPQWVNSGILPCHFSMTSGSDCLHFTCLYIMVIMTSKINAFTVVELYIYICVCVCVCAVKPVLSDHWILWSLKAGVLSWQGGENKHDFVKTVPGKWWNLCVLVRLSLSPYTGSTVCVCVYVYVYVYVYMSMEWVIVGSDNGLFGTDLLYPQRQTSINLSTQTMTIFFSKICT